ncbi:MAG: hypothetical protein WC897_04350 [Candidatus Gracilibacteria bacterium]
MVIPWKLLIKVVLVIAIIPFVLASYNFFVAGDAKTKSDEYYAIAKTYSEAGELPNATNAVLIAEQNITLNKDAKSRAYLHTFITIILLGGAGFFAYRNSKKTITVDETVAVNPPVQAQL